MPFGSVGSTFHRSQRDKLPRFRNLEKTGVQLAFVDVKTQNKHNPPERKKRVTPRIRSAEFRVQLVRLESCCA